MRHTVTAAMAAVAIVVALLVALAGPVTAEPATEVVAGATPNVADVRSARIAPSYAGAVRNDPRRGSGTEKPLLVQWQGSTATMPADLTVPATRLVVYARGERCQRWPQMVVRIDGVVVLDRLVTTSESLAATAFGWWAPGRHEVSVAFVGDVSSSVCDQVLKVSQVVFDTGTMGDQLEISPADLNLFPAGLGAPFRSGTDGRWALGMWSNGVATMDVVMPKVSQIFAWVRGDQCEGPPLVQLSVDGRVVADREVPSSSASGFDIASADLTAGAGIHQVTVRFVNDHRTPACDRNLKLLRLWVFADTVPS